MDLDIKNRVAVVTGAGGGGIGTVLCQQLAREGARVVANDIDRSWADRVVEEINGMGGTAVATYADVTSLTDCQKMVGTAIDAFGRVDIMVTIPAYMEYKAFANCTPEELHSQVDVTFWGVVHSVKAVLDTMIKQRTGSIVCMGSDSARMAPPMETMYASAKAGIMTFASSLSKEIGRYGIRINVVNTALVKTPAHAYGTEEAFRGNYPLGRLAETQEIVEAILFLASDEARYVTGAEIFIDGAESLLIG